MKLRWPWARRTSGHDMTCREAVALITAYLDGALGLGEHDRLERHLDECPHCAEHLKQIEATILVSGTVHSDDLAPDVQQDLIGLFRRWYADGEPD